MEHINAPLLRDLLVIIAALVGLLVGLKSLFHKPAPQQTQITPQPLIVELKKQFALREDVEARVTKLETSFHNQLVEIRAYLHEGLHGLRNQLQQAQNTADTGREGIHARISTLVEVTYEMRGVVHRLEKEMTK
jgi:hypothetical protein